MSPRDISHRVLVSLVRSVPEDRSSAYDKLWEALRQISRGPGVNAWRFVSAERTGRHIEFLEFAGVADPRDLPAAREVLERMDAEIGLAEVEEWVEVPP